MVIKFTRLHVNGVCVDACVRDEEMSCQGVLFPFLDNNEKKTNDRENAFTFYNPFMANLKLYHRRLKHQNNILDMHTDSGVNDYIYVRTLNHVTGGNQVKARNQKIAFTCTAVAVKPPYFLTEIGIFEVHTV